MSQDDASDPELRVIPGWPEAFEHSPDLSFDRRLTIADADWWHTHFTGRGGLFPSALVTSLFAGMPGRPHFVCRALDTLRGQFNIFAEARTLESRWSGCVIFDIKDGSIVWDEISSSDRGLKLGRQMARNILDMAVLLNLQWLRISAENVGSYLWAEAGFIPDMGAWLSLRHDLRTRLHRFPDISRGSRNVLDRVLRCADVDTDPGDIRIVASLDDRVARTFSDDPKTRAGPYPPKERLGKELLIGLRWRGALDIGDRQHRQRLEEWLDTPAR